MQPPLLLSCKLTHAALKFLERRGEDLEPLYERFDWPLHYLRDSSSWLEADRLEYVLATLEELYGPRILSETGHTFFEVVGHASPQLRAWGALDSVLRIVPGIRELYQQPDRFLASFISPQPAIRGLKHANSDGVERTEFRIDFSDDRMPHAARYLRAAFEALPEFIGKSRSHVTWSNGHVLIEWSERQVPFVPMSAMAPHEVPSLSPELLRTILVDLANAQRELESTRRALTDRETELQKFKSPTLSPGPKLMADDTQLDPALSVAVAEAREQEARERELRMKLALHEIYKLGDYFARAQQMVTILRGPSGPTGSTKVNAEAMVRRTAWDRVSQEAPEVIRKAARLLQVDIPLNENGLEQLPVIEGPAALGNPSKTSDRSAQSKHRAPSFFDSMSDDRHPSLTSN